MSELDESVTQYVDDNLDTETMHTLIGIVSDLDPYETKADGTARWSEVEQEAIKEVVDQIGQATGDDESDEANQASYAQGVVAEQYSGGDGISN